MPYALYLGKRGGTQDVQGVGKFESGVAIMITHNQAKMLKNRRGIIVFDRVAGLVDKAKPPVNKYNSSLLNEAVK